jgi:hypothetical protein
MKENHGKYNGLFSEENKAKIKEIILANDIPVGSLFTSATFVVICPKFKCFDQFIHDFKERNSFSSRKDSTRDGEILMEKGRILSFGSCKFGI